MKINSLIFLAALATLALSTAIHEMKPSLTHQPLATHHAVTGSSAGVGSILAGFVLGPFLFFCALVCIWFNEKRAAIDSRRLKLASQICQDVDVNSQASSIKQQGKLVYASGQTRTNQTLCDPLSNVSGNNLIKMIRTVQVLEWRRHTRKQNQNYESEYYELEWVSTNSTNQGSRYNNPSNWFISNDTIYNTKVYLGGYNIDKTTADLCQKSIPFTPNLQHAQTILKNTQNFNRSPTISGEYIYLSPPSGNMGNYGQGNMMMGQMTQQGEGTVRVKYSLCPTGQISICARSTGATFTPFPIAEYQGTTEQTNAIPDCCCCCVSACYAQLLKPIETIHLVEQKNLGKGEMFDLAVKKSETMTRLLRIGCYLLMVISICLFFSPITTLLGYIPLLGGLLSTVVSWAIFIAALIICLPIYLLVTSIAWLRYHPKVGIAILLIGGAILAVILIINSKKADSSTSSQNTSHYMTLSRFPHI